MSPFVRRLLYRSFAVAVALGVVGYVFAEVFLLVLRMNGAVHEPANDAVRWKTPLTMAGIGVVLHVIVEIIANALRPKKKSPAVESATVAAPANDPSGSPAV